MREDDPNGTKRLTIRLENQYVKILKDLYKEFFKLIDELYEDTSKVKDLVLLQAPLTPNALDQQLKQLQARIGAQASAFMKDVAKQTYLRARDNANNQLNRIHTEQQPPQYAGLSRQDLQIIKTLQDTDFSLIVTLNQQQIARARLMFVDAMNNGTDRRDLIKQFQAQLGAGEYQARRIVRTEVTRTANTAHRKQYLQAGIEYWKWNTALDERVCEICGPLHNKIIRIGDPLNIYLDYEGQQRNRGHIITQPPAHPFCRCGMLPVPRDEAIKKAKRPPAVDVPTPSLKGFTDRKQNIAVRELIEYIPSQVRAQVKSLNGKLPIMKVNGRLIDDPEVQRLIPPAILQRYSNARALYIGGSVNRIFVSNNAGVIETSHEIGHSIYDEYLLKRMGLRPIWRQIHQFYLNSGNMISPRASINEGEHFADAFRYYLTSPSRMRAQFPLAYNFIRQHILLGNQLDSIITLEEE